MSTEERRYLMQSTFNDEAQSKELARQVRAFGESIEMNCNELMPSPDDDVPLRRMTMQAFPIKKMKHMGSTVNAVLKEKRGKLMMLVPGYVKTDWCEFAVLLTGKKLSF